ncbi:MAG: hypothetical protein KGH52_02620, partial [Candidatus Micrarchaeota archaeon]|nr:hypothetical protein [Candidatus Micrarchaeota archaeon]
MGSPYPRVAAFAFLLLIFNIAYAAPLVVPNALPASQTIMQGNTATMTVATPTGGAKPYTYQWLEISPGNSLFANAI